MTNEEAWRSLTALQAEFVRQYLITRNASEAMRVAGYKSKNPNVDASKLLAKPSIQFIVSAAEKEAQEKFQVTRDTVLEGLCNLAFNHVGRLSTWDDDGNVTFKASADLETNDLRFITTIRKITKTYGDPKNPTTITTVELETLAPQRHKALESLAKHLGLLEYKDDGNGTHKRDRSALLERVAGLMGRRKGRTGA